MIILIGVMEYIVFVILFGFEFCMLFDVIGFELKRQKQPSRVAKVQKPLKQQGIYMIVSG